MQRPASVKLQTLTVVEEQTGGQRLARAIRTVPRHMWPLTYAILSKSQADTLQAFYQSQGSIAPFTFLDPLGNLCPYSDDFSVSAWEKYSVTLDGAPVGDPFGGPRATRATGGTNGMLATTVLPDGGANGIVLCASVYAWCASSQQLAIGFVDSGFALLASRTWQLRPGWQRIWCSTTLATESYIRMLIGGLNTWGGSTLQLFGAQCVPMSGPGDYQRSPGRYGLRNVRFDGPLEIRYTETGAAASLTLIEVT